jgi:hypothetical protein
VTLGILVNFVTGVIEVIQGIKVIYDTYHSRVVGIGWAGATPPPKYI